MLVLEPIIDASALAEQLGVTRRWVYSHVEEHGLPHYRFGKALAFEASAVRAWLDEHRAGQWPGDCSQYRRADFISGNVEQRADG